MDDEKDGEIAKLRELVQGLAARLTALEGQQKPDDGAGTVPESGLPPEAFPFLGFGVGTEGGDDRAYPAIAFYKVTAQPDAGVAAYTLEEYCSEGGDLVAYASGRTFTAKEVNGNAAVPIGTYVVGVECEDEAQFDLYFEYTADGVVVKITGNDAHGGKYDGRIYSGEATYTSGSDLTMPEGLTDSTIDCKVYNLDEDGLPTHWLKADTFAVGKIIGATTDTPPKPIIAVSTGPARTASPQQIGGTGVTTGATAGTWTRGALTSGTDYGNCPGRRYYQRVWRDDSNKKLVATTWYEDWDASGRRIYVSGETDAVLLETCS